jgi:hypothetical protein
MTRKIGVFLCSLMLGGAGLVFAQGYSPQVTMSITMPDGKVQTLTTHESGTATLTVNGIEYGFRPTMLDDQGTRDVITIFKMGTKTTTVSVLGDVEVRLNAPAIAAKTSPVFKVAVTKIDSSKMLM